MSAFTVEADGTVAVIVFDQPGPVNMLTVSVGDEILGLLDRFGRDSGIEAAVLVSGKRDVFIAGADIDQFVALESEADAKELSRRGQQMMEGLAAWPKPIVAAIHGACLGGGLEMALAARYRLASDASVTELGFPEVQLGIIPAAGGCQRLPRSLARRVGAQYHRASAGGGLSCRSTTGPASMRASFTPFTTTG